MTHPTRSPASALTAADAMRRLTNREIIEMCLGVDTQMGSPAATKLLDLFGPACRAAKAATPPETEAEARAPFWFVEWRRIQTARFSFAGSLTVRQNTSVGRTPTIW